MQVPPHKIAWVNHPHTLLLLEGLARKSEELLVASCEAAFSNDARSLDGLRVKQIQLATIREVYALICKDNDFDNTSE